MEVQHSVARSKHCCCSNDGEYSLFRVSKFQTLVEDIIIIIIISISISISIIIVVVVVVVVIIIIIIIKDLFFPILI